MCYSLLIYMLVRNSLFDSCLYLAFFEKKFAVFFAKSYYKKKIAVCY